MTEPLTSSQNINCLVNNRSQIRVDYRIAVTPAIAAFCLNKATDILWVTLLPIKAARCGEVLKVSKVPVKVLRGGVSDD